MTLRLRLVVISLLVGACTMAGDTQREQIDRLWDFGDPAGSEAAFRALLADDVVHSDKAFQAELLTQIARAQGLQQKFDQGHATLDDAGGLATSEMDRAQVRILLERGRLINSSGKPGESITVFQDALGKAQAAGIEYDAVDAAHMLGIVTQGDASIRWNEEALALARSAKDPLARKWIEALCNNLGWTYHGQGRHEDALKMFEAQLPHLQGEGQAQNLGICRWSIAKMYRHLGRAEEALAIQTYLLDYPGRQGNTSEGYTHEEIGECLLVLNREGEAGPYFARAWELLKDDPWLSRDEAPRLERMKRLGGIE